MCFVSLDGCSVLVSVFRCFVDIPLLLFVLCFVRCVFK